MGRIIFPNRSALRAGPPTKRPDAFLLYSTIVNVIKSWVPFILSYGYLRSSNFDCANCFGVSSSFFVISLVWGSITNSPPSLFGLLGSSGSSSSRPSRPFRALTALTAFFNLLTSSWFAPVSRSKPSSNCHLVTDNKLS